MMTSETQQETPKAGFNWQNPSWVLLLIVLPWAAGIVYSLYEWRLDSAIAARQQTTNGTITAHEPANHNRYGYVFSMSGGTYRGWEYPQKREYSIGEQVTVYYDPTNPSRSSLTEFDELSLRAFGPVPLLLFGTGGVAFYIYKRRKHLRMAAHQSLL